MTRRLILMRHAKSDWGTGDDDHDRPLNARGRGDAPRVGEALRELGWVPDLVVLSDSARTTVRSWLTKTKAVPCRALRSLSRSSSAA